MRLVTVIVVEAFQSQKTPDPVRAASHYRHLDTSSDIPMLNFITSFFAPTSNQQLEQLIRDIANRSLAGSRRRLHGDVTKMSVAELRGYVRARAIRTVRERAMETVGRRQLPVATIDDVIQRALERTVHMLVRQVMVQPVTLPAVPVTRRAAA